jgi:hypothetical protein
MKVTPPSFIEHIEPKSNEMIISFCITLNNVIDIPHGTNHPFLFQYDGCSDKPARMVDPIPDMSRGNRWHYNIHATFFQIPSPLSLDNVDASLDVMKTYLPKFDTTIFQSERQRLSEKTNYQTVVVAQCITKRATDFDRQQALMESALNDLLEHLNVFQNAYHYATSRGVISAHPLVSTSTLPAVMPYTIRFPTTKKGKSPVMSSVFHIGSTIRSLEKEKTFPKTNYESTVNMIPNALHNGFSALLDLQREALLAYSTGNRLTASVLIGAWAESYLQIVIRLLWWESGKTANDAAKILTKRGTTTSSLIKSALSPVLGNKGDVWSQDSLGTPLNLWRRNVADLRNRSIHAGYRPTKDEMNLSLNSLTELAQFVSEKIVSKSKDYPLTALMIVTKEFFEKNATNAARQHAENTLDDMQDDPAHLFEAWLKDVESAISEIKMAELA